MQSISVMTQVVNMKALKDAINHLKERPDDYCAFSILMDPILYDDYTGGEPSCSFCGAFAEVADLFNMDGCLAMHNFIGLLQ